MVERQGDRLFITTTGGAVNARKPLLLIRHGDASSCRRHRRPRQGRGRPPRAIAPLHSDRGHAQRLRATPRAQWNVRPLALNKGQDTVAVFDPLPPTRASMAVVSPTRPRRCWKSRSKGCGGNRGQRAPGKVPSETSIGNSDVSGEQFGIVKAPDIDRLTAGKRRTGRAPPGHKGSYESILEYFFRSYGIARVKGRS